MDCKMITIWHVHVLFYFSPEEFAAFKRFTENLDIEQSLFPFPDGEDRLVLCTPNRDINFTFSLDEWDDFSIALNEATYMQGVYELINQ